MKNLVYGLGYIAVSSFVTGLLFWTDGVNFASAFLIATIGLILLKTVAGSYTALFIRTAPEHPSQAEWPLVDVIVPAYNEEENIPRITESINEVDYPSERLNVLISYERASDDETALRSRRAEERYSNVTSIEHSESAGGKAKNINFALKFTRGEMIAILDADQVIHPSAIKKAARWFLLDNVECVRGRYYCKRPTRSILALLSSLERHLAEIADLYARDITDGFTIYGGGHVFFRRAFLKRLDGFDENILLDDVEMATRVHLHGGHVRVDPTILTFGENPSSLSGWWSQRKRWIRGWMQVMNKHLKSVLTSNRMNLRKKIDAGMTLIYSIFPALLLFILPAVALWSLRNPIQTLLIYVLFTLIVYLSMLPIYYLDYENERNHSIAEFFAPVIIGGYLLLQLIVFYVCVIDEYLWDAKSSWLD